MNPHEVNLQKFVVQVEGTLLWYNKSLFDKFEARKSELGGCCA